MMDLSVQGQANLATHAFKFSPFQIYQGVATAIRLSSLVAVQRMIHAPLPHVSRMTSCASSLTTPRIFSAISALISVISHDCYSSTSSTKKRRAKKKEGQILRRAKKKLDFPFEISFSCVHA